jgi:hypothetical protein
MRDRIEDQDTRAARIAAPLQASERADPTFATRVMNAVRDAHGMTDEPPVLRSALPWWRRSVALRVSPLGGLALAAGLAAVVLAGAELLSGRGRPPGVPQRFVVRQDTVHVVRFVFVAPGASSVAIVGDFNRWDVKAHQLTAAKTDVWTVSLPLTAGRHEYAFVIDGTRWVADPAAVATIADEFGGESSIITVAAQQMSRSS